MCSLLTEMNNYDELLKRAKSKAFALTAREQISKSGKVISAAIGRGTKIAHKAANI